MAHAGQVLIDWYWLLVDCDHVYGVLIAALLRALMIFAVASVPIHGTRSKVLRSEQRVGRIRPWSTRQRSKRAGCLCNLRAPRPARLHQTMNPDTQIEPADSRYE